MVLCKTKRNKMKWKICTLWNEKSVLCEVKNLYFAKWKIWTLQSEISVLRLLSSCSLTYQYNCDRKLAVAGMSNVREVFCVMIVMLLMSSLQDQMSPSPSGTIAKIAIGYCTGSKYLNFHRHERSVHLNGKSNLLVISVYISVYFLFRLFFGVVGGPVDQVRREGPRTGSQCFRVTRLSWPL